MKTIKFKFNERKAVQAAERLIIQSGGEMNYMALIKLLYLIDRESLLRFGRPVTGDAVVAMKQGPVLSAIFDRVSHRKQQLPKCAWHNFIPRPSPYVYTVRFGDVPDISSLSEAEVALIDEVYARHRNLSEDDLVELTHKLPEWSDPGKTSKPIPFEAILRADKRGEDEIKAIQREAAADDFLDRVLAPA
ncbi:MAG: Panacea domain-containing protein [Candidatus Omnitrophica bacterium]|nr:Panacea domain-containing protein [Candidatus Omnitrophota bacterium]